MSGSVSGLVWCIWDINKNQRAGISSYSSREQAEAQIALFKERKARGGRPDIDPSGYVARIEDNVTRSWMIGTI